MKSEFESKVVLVTGGGSNLGRGIAMAFAAAGAKVYVLDNSAEHAEETCRLIQHQGGRATPAVIDVTDLVRVIGTVQSIVGNEGRLDILVNFAGIPQHDHIPLAEISEDQFDRIVNINLKGMWICMKAAIPHMLQQGSGCIVNASSIYGLMGGAGTAIYSTTKHAILGLTKSAALEYGPKGIRVNAVCPGRQTHTMRRSEPKHASSAEARAESDRLMCPASHRAGTPEEVAGTVLFLCSSIAASTHGQAIAVDGGFSIA